MTLNILVLYALLGGIEFIFLYKKEGKSKVVVLYLSLYLVVMVLGLFTLLGLVDRNFSFIMKFW